MSISAMAVTTVTNPKKVINLEYNKGAWVGNLNLSDLSFNTASDMISYLKSKYSKLYFFRINLAKTFGGNWVKPKELYQSDMDNEDSIPNCIMVKTVDGLKLVTVKAKRAKEFVTFASRAKNIYVPVMLYKDSKSNIQLINFK